MTTADIFDFVDELGLPRTTAGAAVCFISSSRTSAWSAYSHRREFLRPTDEQIDNTLPAVVFIAFCLSQAEGAFTLEDVAKLFWKFRVTVGRDGRDHGDEVTYRAKAFADDLRRLHAIEKDISDAYRFTPHGREIGRELNALFDFDGDGKPRNNSKAVIQNVRDMAIEAAMKRMRQDVANRKKARVLKEAPAPVQPLSLGALLRQKGEALKHRLHL